MTLRDKAEGKWLTALRGLRVEKHGTTFPHGYRPILLARGRKGRKTHQSRDYGMANHPFCWHGEIRSNHRARNPSVALKWPATYVDAMGGM